jgi:5-methyltetrahydrofolate--homocysteine methyltransferase
MALLSLLDVLAQRALVADGAMGTMLQSVELSLDDFAGLDGGSDRCDVV